MRKLIIIPLLLICLGSISLRPEESIPKNNIFKNIIAFTGYHIGGTDLFAEMIPPYYANVYYIRWDGNDSNSGTGTTAGTAWKTIQKSYATSVPGDSTYVMDAGGTFMFTEKQTLYPNRGTPIGSSGTELNPIWYGNYPGDSPVFDMSLSTTPSYNACLEMERAEWIKYRGIKIQNVFQNDGTITGAFTAALCANIHIENMVFDNIGERGVWYTSGAWNSWDGPDTAPFESDSSSFVNNDFSNICDTFVVNPGNAGDAMKLHAYQNNHLYFKGNRMWNYSDDGIDPSGNAYKTVDTNRFMSTNKYVEFGIEGNGLKTAGINSTYWEPDSLKYTNGVPSTDTILVKVSNNLAIYCPGIAFLNGVEGSGQYNNAPLFRNNVAWVCGAGFRDGRGGSIPIGNQYYNNNIYGSTLISAIAEPYHVYFADAFYIERANMWDIDNEGSYPYFVVSDTTTTDTDDVITADSLALTALFIAPRNADGSLPTDPLQIASDSDLRGAGVDKGKGTDMWYYDYEAPGSAELPNVVVDSIGVKARLITVTGNVNDDGGGTVSARGVCWAETEDPDLGDNVLTSGSGTGTYTIDITGLDVGTTYHIRTYATNQAGTKYSDDYTIITLAANAVSHEGTILIYNGTIIKY